MDFSQATRREHRDSSESLSKYYRYLRPSTYLRAGRKSQKPPVDHFQDIMNGATAWEAGDSRGFVDFSVFSYGRRTSLQSM